MQSSNTSIHIEASFKKRYFALLGSLAFVAIGCFLVYLPSEEGDGFFHYFTPAKISGWASILFFGVCILILIFNLKSSQLGLLISDTGITDYSGPIAAGFIPWSDVLDLQVIEIEKQRIMLVLVKDSDLYIQRQTNAFKKQLMSMNDKYYGTPIHITTNGLKIKFDALEQLMFQRFETIVRPNKNDSSTHLYT